MKFNVSKYSENFLCSFYWYCYVGLDDKAKSVLAKKQQNDPAPDMEAMEEEFNDSTLSPVAVVSLFYVKVCFRNFTKNKFQEEIWTQDFSTYEKKVASYLRLHRKAAEPAAKDANQNLERVRTTIHVGDSLDFWIKPVISL